MKNRITSLNSKLRCNSKGLPELPSTSPLESLQHALVALKPHQQHCAFSHALRNERSSKSSAQSPHTSFPGSRQRLSKTCTPMLSLYFFVPYGLPATSLICWGCHSNGNAARRLSPLPLVEAHRVWEGCLAH